MLLKDEFSFMKKSKVKAGEGKKEGKYPFFTSSDTKILFLDDYLFDDEAVIIGTGGMPSCNYYNGKFSTSTDNFVLKAKGKTKAKTLYYFLRNNNLSVLEKGFHGAGLKHIGKDYLENVVLPSIAEEEQKTLIADLDSVALSIKKIDELLIKQDELVKSRFIEMFGYRLLNLDTKISSIAEPIIGLTYKPENVTNNGTIVLRSGNIKNNELQLEEDVVRVSNIKIPDNKIIRDNDILMCSRNGSARLVGKSCLIHNPKERMSFGAFMTVIRTKYPYFLQAFFSSDFFKEQLTSVATTSVNQITSGMLNNYNVIEPTEKEELIFSRFVQLIDKSKFILQKQKKNLEELFELKLHQYFGD